MCNDEAWFFKVPWLARQKSDPRKSQQSTSYSSIGINHQALFTPSQIHRLQGHSPGDGVGSVEISVNGKATFIKVQINWINVSAMIADFCKSGRFDLELVIYPSSSVACYGRASAALSTFAATRRMKHISWAVAAIPNCKE
jgi:hypothetical protein